MHPNGMFTHRAGHGAPRAAVAAPAVATAPATGVEAPSLAIAQLRQPDDVGRGRFGQAGLWLAPLNVGSVILALTARAPRLRLGIPSLGATQIASLAKAATLTSATPCSDWSPPPAAACSFQAGPELLTALWGRLGGNSATTRGRINRRHIPYVSVPIFLAASSVVIAAVGRQEQWLVLFRTIGCFFSF